MNIWSPVKFKSAYLVMARRGPFISITFISRVGVHTARTYIHTSKTTSMWKTQDVQDVGDTVCILRLSMRLWPNKWSLQMQAASLSKAVVWFPPIKG